MFFRSLADLNRDLDTWLWDIPRPDLVVGVPRSGLLVATLLSLKLNVPLVDVDTFAAGGTPWGGARLAAVLTRLERLDGFALVVDDSVHTGMALDEVKAKLAHVRSEIHYAAPYVDDDDNAREKVDHYFEAIPHPRMFEWNMFHHPALARTCMDIDGVLCEDPTDDENDDGIKYSRFLVNSRPKYIPSLRVGWLVTSRLEKYREQTAAWLHQRGVQYDHLVMHPATSGAERRAAGDHGRRKAEVYASVDADLFVESSASQAREILRTAAKPVYCVDTGTMYNPGDVVAGSLSPRDVSARARFAWRNAPARTRRRLARLASK